MATFVNPRYLTVPLRGHWAYGDTCERLSSGGKQDIDWFVKKLEVYKLLLLNSEYHLIYHRAYEFCVFIIAKHIFNVYNENKY